MRIILIGYRGSGKSTVGKLLAKELNVEWYDTDRLIEDKMGCSVKDIFENYGERYFRDLEREVLRTIYPLPPFTVISIGGGTELGTHPAKYIYLKASSETLYDRLEGDSSRPKLTDKNELEEINTMLEIRQPIYEDFADITIEVDDLNVPQVVDKIINKIKGECNG